MSLKALAFVLLSMRIKSKLSRRAHQIDALVEDRRTGYDWQEVGTVDEEKRIV